MDYVFFVVKNDVRECRNFIGKSWVRYNIIIFPSLEMEKCGMNLWKHALTSPSSFLTRVERKMKFLKNSWNLSWKRDVSLVRRFPHEICSIREKGDLFQIQKVKDIGRLFVWNLGNGENINHQRRGNDFCHSLTFPFSFLATGENRNLDSFIILWQIQKIPMFCMKNEWVFFSFFAILWHLLLHVWQMERILIWIHL